MIVQKNWYTKNSVLITGCIILGTTLQRVPSRLPPLAPRIRTSSIMESKVHPIENDVYQRNKTETHNMDSESVTAEWVISAPIEHKDLPPTNLPIKLPLQSVSASRVSILTLVFTLGKLAIYDKRVARQNFHLY